MKIAFTISILIQLSLNFSLSAQMDSDNDGMDDDWEIANALDSDDPKDAFADNDGDYTLNLQEFILGTDPNDTASPVIYEHPPEDPLQNVYDRMFMASEETTVIRMTGGVYEFEYGATAHGNYRLMIQGGWNEDFTEYDPCKYPTVLNPRHNQRRFATISMTASFASYMGVAIDGIEFGAGEFDFGMLQLFSYSVASYFHVHNCKFSGSSTNGLFPAADFGCPSMDVTVSSSVFADNLTGGIAFACDANDFVNARIINCTFENPSASAGAIEFYPRRVPRMINVKIVNSILWNNGALGPFSGEFEMNELIIETENCSLEPMTFPFQVIETNTINIAPEYNDSAIGDFTLVDDSPLVDAGLPTGLPYSGTAIDIGGSESGRCMISSIEKLTSEKNYKSYPNPIFDKHIIELDPAHSYQIEIRDVTGMSYSIEVADKVGFVNLDFESFVPGVYFVEIREKNNQFQVVPIRLIKL